RGLVGPLARPVPGAPGGVVRPAGPPEIPAAPRPGRAAAGPAAPLSGTSERGHPRDADRGRRRQAREAAPDPPPAARPAAVVAPDSGCLRRLAGDAVTTGRWLDSADFGHTPGRWGSIPGSPIEGRESRSSRGLPGAPA